MIETVNVREDDNRGIFLLKRGTPMQRSDQSIKIWLNREREPFLVCNGITNTIERLTRTAGGSVREFPTASAESEFVKWFDESGTETLIAHVHIQNE